jgi:hypothetical protein
MASAVEQGVPLPVRWATKRQAAKESLVVTILLVS